jgi:hypothetical protein
VCGTAAGFTTFVAHAGGPPFAIYLLPLRLATAVYVGTTVVYFTVMNALKVVPYAQLGLFDARTLWTAAVMLPVAIGGMLLGLWLRRPDPNSSAVAYTLLFATGTKLLFGSLRVRAGRFPIEQQNRPADRRRAAPPPLSAVAHGSIHRVARLRPRAGRVAAPRRTARPLPPRREVRGASAVIGAVGPVLLGRAKLVGDDGRESRPSSRGPRAAVVLRRPAQSSRAPGWF